ncbi:MAG TPA: SDR family NAD(P)-dependent oxidoreductase [Acidimicrobiales bacterium]|nr:SDR family NAD(P)-dependent oxidoreductase [Acidimicrobiales bacterium]
MEFCERYGPWAVVAGASEGIGASVSRLLGERGVNVVLVSRRQGALDEVASTVQTSTRTVALDLSIRDADAALAAATQDLDVGLLVYNAGADPYASRFLDQPLESWAGLVRRNVDNVLGASYRFAKPMAARGHGGIVLVTSGAAWAGGAYIAAYGASKAFDLVLGEALWAELKPLGVDVLSIVLGMTDTPAFRRMLHGRDMPGIASADDVARDMLDNLADGPTWPPAASPFGAMTRREAVELMSQGSAFLAE